MISFLLLLSTRYDFIVGMLEHKVGTFGSEREIAPDTRLLPWLFIGKGNTKIDVKRFSDEFLEHGP